MRKHLLLTTVLGALGLASSTNAAITVSVSSGPNFDTFNNNMVGDTSGASDTLWGPITFSTAGGSPQGAVEDSTTGFYAQPDHGDDTNYLFAAGGGSATITWDHTLTTFDLFWGSIDTFNALTLSNGDSIDGATAMSELGIAGDPSGSQTLWVQVSDTTPFNAFTASSSQPAFEFDLPGPAVPEPPTWAILLTGFACLRFAYRRCRRAQVQVIG